MSSAGCRRRQGYALLWPSLERQDLLIFCLWKRRAFCVATLPSNGPRRMNDRSFRTAATRQERERGASAVSRSSLSVVAHNCCTVFPSLVAISSTEAQSTHRVRG